MILNPLNIFTSRYSNKNLAACGLIAVGISAFPPRFKLKYALSARLRELAPTPALLAQARSNQVTPRQFELEYEPGLELLGVERILGLLSDLQREAPGLVLLCFEDVNAGQRCHRRMLADWLKRKGGISVEELPEPGRASVSSVQAPLGKGTAVGYCRRSVESTEKTVSLAAQRAAIERYVREQGWHLAAVLEHDGISGGKRSRFAPLDAAVKSYGARYVVAYHLDRVARDAAALLDWCASAAKRGVELHIVGRGRMETGSASGYLTVGVEGLVAAHYRLVTAEKTAAALRHLRESGKRWTRVPPFGHRWTRDGGVEPDPGELAVVERARELRAAGLSLRKVAGELAAEGKLGRAGRPLSAETVNSIVRANPVSASTGHLRH